MLIGGKYKLPKGEIVPCSKEEMDRLLEKSMENEFYYMFFSVAKTTGRRIGELYGSQKKKVVGRKIIGKKVEYDEHGKEVALAKTRVLYKKIPNQWEGGVKVKDIDFDNGMMKIWVLKRRKLVQDETILTKEVLNIIKHYVVRNKLKQEDYLFRKKSYRAIQDAIKSYAKKAEIPHKVSVHNFRHYFITELKRKGWSDSDIKKLTGHKSTASLYTYDHIVAKDIKEKALGALKDL